MSRVNKKQQSSAVKWNVVYALRAKLNMFGIIDMYKNLQYMDAVLKLTRANFRTNVGKENASFF